MKRAEQIITHPLRLWIVLAVLFAALAVLAARAVQLQVVSADYLQAQGNARHLRVVEVAASRGMIVDRDGEPLAISTPVESVWADPGEFQEGRDQWGKLASLLEMAPRELARLYARNADREFMYLKRHVTPELARKVEALEVPGVGLRREYRRYYPSGPIAGHVVGFTDVDDRGLEGIELAFDDRLRGRPGKKQVIRDGRRDIIQDVENIQTAVDGSDVVLSIDARIQYLAFRALKAAVAENHARSGSVVVVDSRSGEILAMVNEPDFNPNNRSNLGSSRSRNRAVTDVFEPGSTLKPFTIATALETHRFSPDTRIETSPGFIKIGKYTIRDHRDYGLLTVSRVIVKSSNVGASKIALQLEPQAIWNTLRRVGFGDSTGSGLPGESTGRLMPWTRWHEVEQATMAFGYGIAVTPLQLAQAYQAIANDGVLIPVTILRRDQPVIGERAFAPSTAHEIRAMLEMAVSDQGTGSAARVPRYRVAGKTGTVHISTSDGYAEDRYTSVFAGMAPASSPRLVMMVMIEEPRAGRYYGGEVAAPVFARVMAGALRLLNISPDAAEPVQHNAATQGGRAPT
jgi:cell division protein FtsI (penicillin-binding protein 3)